MGCIWCRNTFRWVSLSLKATITANFVLARHSFGLKAPPGVNLELEIDDIFEIMVPLLCFRTLQSVKIESAKIKFFLIAFLDDLGNFKHFEPYLFFRTFDFYTLQSAIVKQRYLTVLFYGWRLLTPRPNWALGSTQWTNTFGPKILKYTIKIMKNTTFPNNLVIHKATCQLASINF